jgi:hypothetical protein
MDLHIDPAKGMNFHISHLIDLHKIFNGYDYFRHITGLLCLLVDASGRDWFAVLLRYWRCPAD